MKIHTLSCYPICVESRMVRYCKCNKIANFSFKMKMYKAMIPMTLFNAGLGKNEVSGN